MLNNHSNEEMSKNGIYRITNLITRQTYVGSAASHKSKNKSRRGFYSRYADHLNKLLKNKHHNHYLQNSWNKYKPSNFIFEIVKFCEPDECISEELYYIDLYESMINQNGYNIIRQSLGNHTGIFTKEHREKISKSLIGRPRPESLKRKLGVQIHQFTTNNEFVNTFYSMSEASRQTGIQRQDIGQSIIGIKCKTAGGFVWKKDEDIV